MKKALSSILAAGMLFTLTACSSQQSESDKQEETVREWTRQGYYGDASDNMLSITPSEYEEYPGWYVGCLLGEEAYGWFIQQEGNTLHGNIVPDYEDGEFIVTVSEEGEDGILLTTESGETYHFTPMDLPEATIFVTINTEGMGAVEYAKEGTEIEFDPEYPYTSAQLNLAEPETYTFEAFEYLDEWKFIKWTKDGEDYSTDAVITVELTESADFVAVFDIIQ